MALPRPFLRAALAFCLMGGALSAHAELMLNPTRVVFNKNQRAAQVELINNGSEAATYRISLVNRRMTETGEFQSIDTPGEGELFADPILSYSPRQITLQPGTAQVVRIMVRKPDGLADGEYRSHLHFEKLPDPKGITSVDAASAPRQQIGVIVNTLIGSSIPVIVRHGATEASVALTGLALQGGADGFQLAFHMDRSGNSSVYGDLAASFVGTGAGGIEHEVGKAGGVAVYAPNPLRRAALPLHAPAGVKLEHGTLRLTYRERPEAGGRVLAQATLALP
ncbi:MAG: molecular chaperone [Gammaproteobacteria bacterium]